MKKVKNAKKMAAVILAVVTLVILCVIGCEKKEDEVTLNVPDGVPTYEDDTQIEMFAYGGPRGKWKRAWNGVWGAHPDDPAGGWEGWIDEETFQDYIDCGFTYLFAGRDGYYDMDEYNLKKVSFEDSGLKIYMDLAEKMGIPVMISSSKLIEITSSTDPRLSQETKDFLSQMISDLSQYEMFYGITFRDEPRIEMVDTFGAVKDYIDSIKLGLHYMTSYLPIYTSDLSWFSTQNQNDREAAYLDYVNAISDAMGTFAYDSYLLMEDPIQGETYIGDTWFQNLYLVAQNAKEKGYDPAITIQSMAFGKKDAQEMTKHNRAPYKKADISFQLYTAMAYGFKEFGFYTYWNTAQVGDDWIDYDTMVRYPEDGSSEPVKTDIYYAAKEANTEIHKFDHVYMNYKWEGTMVLTEEGKSLSNGLELAGQYECARVKSATASTDTLIGCMKDDDGYDGFMIVNATDPAHEITDTVTVTFRQASKAIAYINGDEQTIELKDGSYSFELEPGAGVFVIPIK